MNLPEKFFIKTAAYRTIKNDRDNDSFAHAYLLVCSDETYLRSYVRAFAKAIMCEKGGLCGECRFCKLIDKESFCDCEFYPPEGSKPTTEGIDLIVGEKCFVKPLEAKLKLFCISGAEQMNLPSQNKLLKTLEEPPKNVIIVLGATNTFTLLPTIKSRVRKLEIPSFSEEEIIDVLSPSFPDKIKLKKSAALADGKPGEAEKIYNSFDTEKTSDECVTVLKGLKKSPDIARYSLFLQKKSRDEFAAFISSMRIIVRDILLIKEGKDELLINFDKQPELTSLSEKYTEGALLEFFDDLGNAAAALNNNGNQTMLADKILFALLEENYRWQKS